MAETNGSLLLQALNPKSLILSQFSNPHEPHLLEITTETFVFERGPRFKEYSDLRDRKLRMKSMRDQRSPEKEEDEKVGNRSILTPPKKQVKFSSNFTTPPKRTNRASSVLAQSVPDFSYALRKENRRPAAMPTVAEMSVTPPAKSGKSRSVNSAEKRSGGLTTRKSYASMEELKRLAAGAGNAINGENRGGKSGRGIGSKTVLGSRQF